VAASARAPEDLYGLPLEEFTPARDALAKELRAAGRKDEAAEVRSLRKPSLAAWALNRVVRDHPVAIHRLRSAGADLREAQNQALSGDAGRLRAAGRALAEEVDRVADLAAGALRAAGRPPGPAQREKLVATLRTAAVDDAAGEALARGVLVEDLGATGFDLLGAGAGAGDLSAGPARSTAPTGDRAGRPPEAAGEGQGGGPSEGDRGGVATLPGAHRPEKKPKPSRGQLEAVDAARRELRRCEAEADLAATRARRRAERAETAMQRAAEAQREADEARAAAEEAAGEAEAARRRAADAAETVAAAEAALPS
jgi:hypothetical protein